MRYLLDTDTCIFLFRNAGSVAERLKDVGINNCCISEITKAEILVGLNLSTRNDKQKAAARCFLESVETIPVTNAIDLYAREKARLIKAGLSIEDFDLLIGCTAIQSNSIIVTHNTAHLSRITGIVCEDWA